MMKKIMEFTVHSLAQSIQEIRTNESSVYDIAYIEEFLNNCDRTVFEAIKNRVIELRQASELQPLKITCPSCQHQYDQMFTLDMARFFDSAS
jgi:bacterioferritin-associated ferredoxin